jgi:hypothetical protein
MNKIKFVEADQARLVSQYINTKRKLLRTNDCVSCNGSFLKKVDGPSEDGLLKKPKHVKACANNKCNLITLGGMNEVFLIVLTSFP